jgi:hypothetical protein
VIVPAGEFGVASAFQDCPLFALPDESGPHCCIALPRDASRGGALPIETVSSGGLFRLNQPCEGAPPPARSITGL